MISSFQIFRPFSSFPVKLYPSLGVLLQVSIGSELVSPLQILGPLPGLTPVLQTSLGVFVQIPGLLQVAAWPQLVGSLPILGGVDSVVGRVVGEVQAIVLQMVRWLPGVQPLPCLLVIFVPILTLVKLVS